MAGTSGAILCDGWTNCYTHYFGVYASVMRKVHVLRQGVPHVIEEHTLPLLSVTPMDNASDDGGNDADEASEFDAVTHVQHLDDVFEY